MSVYDICSGGIKQQTKQNKTAAEEVLERFRHQNVFFTKMLQKKIKTFSGTEKRKINFFRFDSNVFIRLKRFRNKVSEYFGLCCSRGLGPDADSDRFLETEFLRLRPEDVGDGSDATTFELLK